MSQDEGGRGPDWSAPDASPPPGGPRPDAGGPRADDQRTDDRPDLVKGPPSPDHAAPGQAPPGALQAPAGWGGPPPPLAGQPVVGDRRGVVPLRPLGLGELLDGAVAVVRGYPRPVFALGAAVAAAGALLELLVLLTLLRPVLGATGPQGSFTATTEEVVGALGGASVTSLFAAASGLLLTGLVAPAVSRGTLAQPLTLREAWEQVRPRLGPLVAASVLITLAVLLPLVAGVLLTAAAVAALGGGLGALVGLVAVPAGIALGVHLYVRWAFVPLCVVLERQGLRAALKRSGVLVRRSWWRVLGILLLTGLIAGIVGQVLQVPFLLLTGNPLEVLSGSDTSTGAFVVASLGTMVASMVVGPFAAAVTGLLYVDRRMRSEGLDVALAAAHRP